MGRRLATNVPGNSATRVGSTTSSLITVRTIIIVVTVSVIIIVDIVIVVVTLRVRSVFIIIIVSWIGVGAMRGVISVSFIVVRVVVVESAVGRGSRWVVIRTI